MKDKILLKDYTTYKIGGPAKYFFVVKTRKELTDAIKFAKSKKLSVFILGGGSNVLVSDKGFKGVVIKIEIYGTDFQGQKIAVGAGLGLAKLSNMAADRGLSGLEWAAGVPGTIGGAIYGNAQAFGTKVSDAVESVEALDMKTLRLKNFAKEQCQFFLKNSVFKKNKNLVIVSAVLTLKNGDAFQIKNKIKEFLDYRRLKHPTDPSAGSVFVNPEKNGEVIPAGSLIEKCGLKGKIIGKAQISEKHCNFIINLGDAKASDVLKLIKMAQQKVKKTFGIKLEPEVQII